MPITGGSASGSSGTFDNHQRAIIYAGASPARRRRQQGTATALSVPNWFDLPLLLPESHPIAARVQRTLPWGEDPPAQPQPQLQSLSMEQVPRISRLSPVKHLLHHKASSRATALAHTASVDAVSARPIRVHGGGGGSRSHLLRKKRTTHAGAPVVLDRIDRKSRLKEKIWKDLNRFGLWYVAGESAADGTVDSLDSTVDAIMQQWEDATAVEGVRGAHHPSGVDDARVPPAEAVHGDSRDCVPFASPNRPNASAPAVFLTALPREAATSPSHDAMQHADDVGPKEDEEAPPSNDDDDNSDENDEEDDDDDEEAEADAAASVPRHEIRPPGMKRRQRLKELHCFVEKQLQKRLFKSWETIETAFTGSGDLTVSQITKFLQHSDVQLSAADAAKVQAILEKHARNVQANEDATELTGPETHDGRDQAALVLQSAKPKAVALSFDAFRRIFHTKDNQEAVKWKREFDREKVRQRHEKEIYEKELAALEERVKKRLAESARVMIDLLAQFRVDPCAIPWESEQQRLEMRAQLFETIFSKLQRRQLLQVATPTADSATMPLAAGSAVPEKLSARIVESALLQKYSRNGHFDAIEAVPATYVYHDFVADCIKKSVARYWQRCEADQWPERQLIFQFRLQKQVFHEWRRFTKHAETLRRFVLRKFVAWKYLTRKLHEHYAFVRTTFWPFYVWKRHLQQQIIARGKSAFLKAIVLTYIQLRHFRALKTRLQRRHWNSRHVARLTQKRAAALVQVAWDGWRSRTQARITIHRLWKSRGHALQRLHKLYMVKVTFYLWRYFAILKSDMQRRAHKCLLEQFAMGKKHRAYGLSSGHGRPNESRHGASWYPTAPLASQQGGPLLSASNPHMVARETVVTDSVEESWSDADYTHVDSVEDSDDVAELSGASRVAFTSAAEQQGFVGASTGSGAGGASLTRIMETELGQKIKRKSRLYDLCLALYLKYREKDRRTMIGNVITFRRVARRFLVRLQRVVEHDKKHRFASDLGSFRVLQQRFQQWMVGTFYKQQLGLIDDAPSHASDGDSDILSEDDVDANGRVKLNWRRDREWRLLAIEQNPSYAQRLREDLRTVFKNDARRAELVRDRELALRRKHQAEEAFLRKEAGATLKAKSAQLQQAQLIVRTRGHRMHDVLDRVYDDLRRQHMRRQLKASFRGLRVVVMTKYTATLCRRAQLRNWLRLCHRFLYWERHMAAFCRAKRKFHAFQSLLKHAVWRWTFQSPGLSLTLQRRRALVLQYELFLERHGLLDGSAASSRLALTRFSPANAFRGVFLRWVQFAQFAHASRRLVALAREKQAIARTQSVFLALRRHVKSAYTLAERQAGRPFLLRQADANLDAYHCKLVALKARLPTTQLRRALARQRRCLLRAATGAPTLKQLFQQHEAAVRRRLSLESRLMFNAYTERKVHHYAERASALVGAPAGRPFAYEPAPPFGSIREVAVTCGKQVDGVALVVRTPAGLSLEGALHGNPFGQRDVFALAKGEVLVAVEGFASQTVYGLRFGTSTGRLSRWFGHCDKGARFELRSDFAGTREEIVGLFGYADSASLHALGAVFRRTTSRNIFEGLWLQSERNSNSDDVALCDRQFAYFLQVRRCDVLDALKRAHRFALQAHRAPQLPAALARARVIVGLARWLFDALAHGLVHNTAREEEGKRVLQDGMNKRAGGEKSLQEALQTLALVDSFCDAEGQLSIATLGARKVAELREALAQAQQRAATARRLVAEGQAEVLAGRRILPRLPMTRRMMAAIRRMYRVVQTKDYIDQMAPDVRAILLEGEGSGDAAGEGTALLTSI
ncbi:hypothetical protein PybrP1_010523 [[Pythium] brassicae (nom. inval.)]|nr:hypothetical protein PybrP1_010523 [[Pythium] brassicae (nom. inval.)]